ncbi:hypothetical protein [Caldalkalibacillus salinus]|uniref:hypothetical protein n=1 Tax=Caldalkalibacillus salinus TaxID=2803787 RepID=UPI001924A3EC|nr:hypothetical protein [Caldalkalibacillus salinus]
MVEDYSVSSICYYEKQKSVDECLQLAVDFKELVQDEMLFEYKLYEYSDLREKELNEYPDMTAKYKYEDISSVDSFQLKYNPSHFYCATIGGNFVKKIEKKLNLNTLFIRIFHNRIRTFTMPEEGEYFVPNLGTNNKQVKTEEVIESQEKFLAQQLRMIQLTEVKCHIAQRSVGDIIEEVPSDTIDDLEGSFLYSAVPPK